MSRKVEPPRERELPRPSTDIPAHLSLDPTWDTLTVIEYGAVWDGQPPELTRGLSEDDRIGFLLREPGGPVIGFMVEEPHDIEVEELDAPELWDGPRFGVPVLGLRAASVGEIPLAIQGRFGPEEFTTDRGRTGSRR